MKLHQCLLVRHVSMCKIAVIMVGLRISNTPMTYSKLGGGGNSMGSRAANNGQSDINNYGWMILLSYNYVVLVSEVYP